MNTSILDVMGLEKCFHSYARERHRFMAWIGLGKQGPGAKKVLENISFRIAPGEAVGVIGENGAGKSTLLKLIAGTMRPTRGTIRVDGTVSAILELGMGFNGEFTGRRNAYHAAALLGFSRADAGGALEEICRFSELGGHFDQPVRTYSSGMRMRLAFSVATARRPDILIVDEALSVGDAYFQHKCMQRIRAFREAGTALLFVSHSQHALRMLCSRGLLLEHGRLVMDADAASVIDYYRAATVRKCEINEPGDPGSRLEGLPPVTPERQARTVLSRGTVEELSVDMLFDGDALRSGDWLTIRIRARFSGHYPEPHAGIGVRNALGVVIYEANTYTLGCASGPVAAGRLFTAAFRFRCDLFPDTYELMIGLADTGYDKDAFERSLFFDQAFRIFEVLPGVDTGWTGLYNLRPRAEVHL